MFPPFDEKEAHVLCLNLIEDINSGKVLLERCAKKSEVRKDSGIMLGVLTALSEDGKKIILKTVSGNAKRLVPAAKEENVFYVPPVVSPEKINEALKKNDRLIHKLTFFINFIKENKKLYSKKCSSFLIRYRTRLTDESLLKVFDLYSFSCSDGKKRSLMEICAQKGKNFLPPCGTGDCCAPRLLDFAFSHKLVPVSMAEVFYGGKDNSTRENGKLYPPCDERCSLILPSMLGLEIIYRDEHVCVINKQSMVLSIPGRGEEKKDSITYRLKRLFPSCIEQPSVHRLDMETSGLMVLAFTKEAHRILGRQFEEGTVKKEYEALLDGVLQKKGIDSSGIMELYFRLDVENRPHQIWDEVHGKKAVTEWKLLDVEYYVPPSGKRRAVTRVLFIPHTGRTHQLRLASSDSHGFATPIIGDTLYGNCEEGERLMLHARKLSFVHPVTQKVMTFECKAPF